MNDLVPYDQIERMGIAIAKSGLFGLKTPEQAVALMLVAQAEGRHPAEAARDYHVIQGRPALKADAMLARFQAAGGTVKWTAYDDDVVSGVFAHPQGGSVAIEWTIGRAQAAGLAGKENWKAYPRQMLRARCISEGIRTVFPGVVAGVYTPEEVESFDPPARNVTPRDEPPVPLKLGPAPELDPRVRCSELADELGLDGEARQTLADRHGGNFVEIMLSLLAMKQEARA